MTINLKIIIPVSFVIGITLFSNSIPIFGSIIEDVQRSILIYQDRCPEISINSNSYQHPTTDWLGKKHCNAYIQYEVKNEGNNSASNIKISCVAKNNENKNLVWDDKKINLLKPNEIKTDHMLLEYPCGYEFSNHVCTVSYENPCQ